MTQQLSIRLKTMRELHGLSQPGNGQASPSRATLEKLADGLGIAAAAFFIEAGSNPDIEIFNLDDRPSVSLDRGGRFVPLTALHQPTGFEPMLVSWTRRRLRRGAIRHQKPACLRLDAPRQGLAEI